MALLGMLRHSVEGMQASAAAAHSDLLAGLLLRALDVRQRQPVSLPGDGVDAVESASVALLVALTLKLSEKRFKPLFLRIFEWASTQPAGQGELSESHPVAASFNPDCSPDNNPVGLSLLRMCQTVWQCVLDPPTPPQKDDIAFGLGPAL